MRLVPGSIDAFKSVQQLYMATTSDDLVEPAAFNEVFFASLAHRGIRYFDSELERRFLEVDLAAAIAYALAEPADDVSRELTGLQFRNEKDFLNLVRMVCRLPRCALGLGRNGVEWNGPFRNGKGTEIHLEICSFHS